MVACLCRHSIHQRFVANSCAPTGIAWSYDNRTAGEAVIEQDAFEAVVTGWERARYFERA